ncbi:MAG: methyltransferase domain-containing protein [Nitrospinae bacterium]|nr:methyltransferase domain-containing protein [Nitrospinota bacterium]
MHGLTYDVLMWPLERAWLGELRRKTLAQARGRVLEIGIGTGLNLPHYAPSLDLVGIDPDPRMLAHARRRAAHIQRPVTWHQVCAEVLPFEDASFDSVVGTLVFCTIRAPKQALHEVLRVLRPNGRIHLLEHVRSPQPLAAHVQDWITPVWKRLFGGCHPNRDTLAIAQAAGVRIEHVEPFFGEKVLIIEGSKD